MIMMMVTSTTTTAYSSLHFSDSIRIDRGGLSSRLETTRRRLAKQLSTSGSTWSYGRLNHRSCLIVSIVRITDITLSCANTLCTAIDRNPYDEVDGKGGGDKKKERREEREGGRKGGRTSAKEISNNHSSAQRLLQFREARLIGALRKKHDEKVPPEVTSESCADLCKLQVLDNTHRESGATIFFSRRTISRRNSRALYGQINCGISPFSYSILRIKRIETTDFNWDQNRFRH